MEGKKYRHSKFGEVEVIRQPNYKSGGPRNILIRTKNGTECIVPQRSLRKLKETIMSETINRIKGFASLGDNWDSYGAKIIELSTINRAINFLSNVVSRVPNAPIPFVSPGPNGEIHFEWEGYSKILNHLIPEDKNDTLEYLITNETPGERTYGKAYNIEKMLDVVVRWMCFNKMKRRESDERT